MTISTESPMGRPLNELLGGRTAAKLATASLVTVSDLLRLYPRRYSERGQLTDLAELVVDEPATIWGRIASIAGQSLHRGRAKHLTKIVLTDGRRSVECAFFNQPWLARALKPGMEVMAAGTVSRFRGALQMSGPDIATVDRSVGDIDAAMQVLETFAGGIIPVYPAVGVPATVLQQCVRQVLDVIGPIPDPVPPAVLSSRGLTDINTALHNVHRPHSRDMLDAAVARLRYDEALAVQLVLARRRAEARQFPARPCPAVRDRLLDAFDASLPFELTVGQREVGAEISCDLARTHPMNRLLQGEVGSGKTVIALRAMLQVVDNGQQAVLLAPTEVLAVQHARSVRALLGGLGREGELGSAPGATTITVLTGSVSAPARRQALLDFASGRPGIALGTHALLSEDVTFANLGLVVVDEQHRFGVEQRDALRSQQTVNPPHVLVMTATPIPRTVAMTVYGDLDVSTLTELPAGRPGVATTVVPAAEKPSWLERVWDRVREEVAAGHQVYVVCPKIGDDTGMPVSGQDSDEPVQDTDPGDDATTTDGKRGPLAALSVAAELRSGPLAGLALAVLHGRMPAADKDAVMRAFAAGEIDVLVSTTVIEVGVDVPNATTMVILDADRFGTSQLHQLRGRVGRGSAAGVCLLVTEAPAAAASRRRLDAVAATVDGFQLAEADLRLRHEGDVLGTSQAGRRSSLRLLSLVRDADLIGQAREDADRLVGTDPTLADNNGLREMADALVEKDAQEFLGKG